jgi:hypothetical protein
MATAEFDPQPQEAYAGLEKTGDSRLIDAIEDALSLLEAAPGDAHARRRSFGDGLWGIPLRSRSDDWLLIWEYDPFDERIVVVRYLGLDPFA